MSLQIQSFRHLSIVIRQISGQGREQGKGGKADRLKYQNERKQGV